MSLDVNKVGFTSQNDPTLEIYENLKYKADTIQKLFDDYSFIREKLNEIESNPLCPVVFKVSIVGGAIRDLILNENNIKDLDILVACECKEDFLNLVINNSEVNSVLAKYQENSIGELNKELKKWGFSENKIAEFNKLGELTNRNYIAKLAFFFLRDMEEIGAEVCFQSNFSEIKKMEYHFNEIMGVIKFKDDSLNYPLDLLISTDRNGLQFVSRFDYNICKVFVSEDGLIDKNVNKFIESVFIGTDFIKDYQNKTITMDIDHYPRDSAINSFDKHFVKIKQKYPEYKFKHYFYSSFNQDDKEVNELWRQEIEYVMSLEKKIELEEIINLNARKNKKPSKKI